jgi:hypothetical protein
MKTSEAIVLWAGLLLKIERPGPTTRTPAAAIDFNKSDSTSIHKVVLPPDGTINGKKWSTCLSVRVRGGNHLLPCGNAPE